MSRRSGGGLPARSMMSAIASGGATTSTFPLPAARQDSTLDRSPTNTFARPRFFLSRRSVCATSASRGIAFLVWTTNVTSHLPALVTWPPMISWSIDSEACDGSLFDRLNCLLPGGAESGANLFGFWMFEQCGRSQHANDLRAGRKISEVERRPVRSEIPTAVCGRRRPSASWLSSPVSLRVAAVSCQRQRSVSAAAVAVSTRIAGCWQAAFRWSAKKRPRRGDKYNRNTCQRATNDQPLLARLRRARCRVGTRIARFFCWTLRHTCLTSLRQAKPGGQPALWLVPRMRRGLSSANM